MRALRGLCWSGEGNGRSVRGVWAIGEGLVRSESKFSDSMVRDSRFVFFLFILKLEAAFQTQLHPGTVRFKGSEAAFLKRSSSYN